MDALFLSGESVYNKTWIEQVARELGPLFEKTAIHHYRHWEQGGPIDFEYEMAHIIEEVKQFKGEYIIFAKSAGSVLGMLGIARGALDPQTCIFVGVPLPLAKRTEDSLATWAHNYHKSSLFIQNKQDPLTSAQELSDYLTTLNLQASTFVSLPGDSHNYPDLKKLYELTDQQLAKVDS